MSRAREYISSRFTQGTKDRADALLDYVAAAMVPPMKRDEVTRSDVLRYVVDVGLDIIERRAMTWRAEQMTNARSGSKS